MSASKPMTIDAIVLADAAYVLEMQGPDGGDGGSVEAWLRAAVHALNRVLKPSMRLAVLKDESGVKIVDVNAKSASSSQLVVTEEEAQSVPHNKLVVFMQYLVVTLGPLEHAQGVQRSFRSLQRAWDAIVDNRDDYMGHIPSVIQDSVTSSGVDASSLMKISSPARRLRPATPARPPASPSRSRASQSGSSPPNWPRLSKYIQNAQT